MRTATGGRPTHMMPRTFPLQTDPLSYLGLAPIVRHILDGPSSGCLHLASPTLRLYVV